MSKSRSPVYQLAPSDQPAATGSAFAVLGLMFLVFWATSIAEPVKKLLQWQQDMLDRLDQFRSLEQGWDSYSGSPISSESLAAAQALLLRVWGTFGDSMGETIRPFAVAPLPYGGVQIEWRGNAGAIEVEIDIDGSLSYLLELGEGGQQTIEERPKASVDNVLHALQQIKAS